MVEQIGSLSCQCRLVGAEGRDDRFGAFLGELSRAALDPGVKQLLGVGLPGRLTGGAR